MTERALFQKITSKVTCADCPGAEGQVPAIGRFRDIDTSLRRPNLLNFSSRNYEISVKSYLLFYFYNFINKFIFFAALSAQCEARGRGNIPLCSLQQSWQHKAPVECPRNE